MTKFREPEHRDVGKIIEVQSVFTPNGDFVGKGWDKRVFLGRVSNSGLCNRNGVPIRNTYACMDGGKKRGVALWKEARIKDDC